MMCKVILLKFFRRLNYKITTLLKLHCRFCHPIEMGQDGKVRTCWDLILDQPRG
jgi:hypothetical protein